jgi:hypothetical protein
MTGTVRRAGGRLGTEEVIMAQDPIIEDADAAVLDWETGLPPIKHEDLPRIIDQKIASELIRLRFEMTAIRQALEHQSRPG